MGRTEQQFLAGARARGYALETGRTVPWLTVHGHLEPALKAQVPSEIIDVLRDVFLSLGGDEELLRAKRSGRLRPDAFLGDRILELDEIQHFSTARLAALERYPHDAPLGFDRDRHMALCRQWAPMGGDRYRASKQTREFPHHGGRTAQRAYFDALRDLAAPHFGAGPVIRIAAPECDPRLAIRRMAATTGVLT